MTKAHDIPRRWRRLPAGTLLLPGVIAATIAACVGDDAAAPGGGADAAPPPTSDASSDAPVDPDKADASASADASDATPAPRCDPSKPFPPPTEVTQLNSAPAVYARLTPDETMVVFNASPDGSPRIYQATRASAEVPFDAPVPVPGIDTLDGGAPLNAGAPTLSVDRLTLYFQSNRNGRVQIFSTTRAAANAPFAAPSVVAALDDPQNTGQPYLSPDGATMYLVSRRVEGKVGGIDLWRTTITAPGVATGFENVTELNTAGNENAPVISADGLTIYFSRAQLPDGGPATGERIWSASRATATGAFGAPTPVTSLWLDGGNDQPSWISPDGCTIYMWSDSSGQQRIYSATRPK